MRLASLSLVGVLLLGADCGSPGPGPVPPFHCIDDGQCMLDGVKGKCEKARNPDAGISGFCAFPSNECDSGYRYDKTAGDLAGQCLPKPPERKPLGQPCATSEECMNDASCVDGVCCSSACSAACMACNLPGSVGTCTFVGAGLDDPRAMCKAEGSLCGTTGRCDGAGGCEFAPTTKECMPPSCTNGMARSAAFCDGKGNCGAPQLSVCDPYVCKADGTGCHTVCTPGSTECKPPGTCMAGSCGLLANGAQCTMGTQCQNGNCVDGVCCVQSSCPTCQKCNVNGVGSCANVLVGGLDSRCGAQPASTCGRDGKCDGAGNCTFWPAGTACVTPTCNNTTVPATATNPQYSMANPYGQCTGGGAPCPMATVTQCNRGMGCRISGSSALCWFSCGLCDPSTGNTAFVDHTRCAAGLMCTKCYPTGPNTGELGCQ
jgi:hypothetical protein